MTEQLTLFWYRIENFGYVFCTDGEPSIPLNGYYCSISRNGKRGYLGQYVNGRFDGRGILIANSGIMYQGYFREGYFHGPGTLFVQNDDNSTKIDIENFPFCLEGKFYDDAYPQSMIKYQGLFLRGIPSSNWSSYYENIEDEQNYIARIEGTGKLSEHIMYERSIANRQDAIKIHGNVCSICGKSPITIGGNEYNAIEVHHIRPISNGPMVVNPETDLITLCANCHSLVHKLMKDFDNPIAILRAYYKDMEGLEGLQ